MTTNADLLKRREAAVPRGVATAHPVFAVKAEGAEIWDVEGRRYIDFVGGIGVQNTGHRHPKVVAAVKAQLDQAIHTAFQVTAYEPYIALAERLNALSPTARPAKTIFFTTGAEAVENAIKIARYATKRSAVISFTGAFHGRTLYAMGLTGKTEPYRAGFGPLPPEIFRLPYPVESHGLTGDHTLLTLEWLFKTDVEPSRVAAVIVEPVQGEGGFYVAPFEFLRKLKAVCERHGILFISDEIQAGFGRTGKLFAIEHSGVTPDLVTTAKSIAAGLPLSGVIGRADLMDAVNPGGLGGTYAGNPLACAAALAVLDIFREEDVLARAEALGARLRGRLQAMARANDLPPIADIRGLGAMVAFDLVKTRGGHDPDPERTRALLAAARGRGLILLTCGLYGNGVRILVPITASDAVIAEGLDLLEASLRDVAG